MGTPYISEDGKHIYAEGTPIVVSENEDGNILVTWDGGSLVADASKQPSVWGGSDTNGKDPVDYDRTSVTVNGGTLWNVTGGNRGPGHIKSSNVVVNDGKLGQAVGAGVGYGALGICPNYKNAENGETIIDESNIRVAGGTFYYIFGGTISGIATVGTANLVVTGGEAKEIIVGNSNGTIGTANGKISGCKSTTCLVGGNRGTVGNINMEVNGNEHNLVAVMGDKNGKFEGKAEVGLYGGTIAKFLITDGLTNDVADMSNMKISYADGVINEDDIANVQGEIKKDNTKGQGAEMKTVRVYPFPHKCNNIFGILVEGMPIDKVSELPMTEQEIRMCLGMAQLFEVVGEKLVLLDEHNYNKDNTDAPEYNGILPCDDCEVVYPRAEKSEEIEEEPVDDEVTVEEVIEQKVEEESTSVDVTPVAE